MDIVIVGGPHSGVGKTLAAERALQALAGRRYGAIKLTVADGEFDAPHARGVCGRGASCGVCETVHVSLPARIVTASGAIGKEGTDTCRLRDAGAVAVAWVIALREAAPAAVDEALAHLERNGARGAVIEGTTAIEWLRPHVSVLVASDPGKHWKRVAMQRLSSFDILLRNRVPLPPGDVPAPAAFAALDPLRCDLADVSDSGTREFQRRLRARMAAAGGALTAKSGASPSA
jgi:molybdopterin-guanine dinucleotide biosynthesis protein